MSILSEDSRIERLNPSEGISGSFFSHINLSVYGAGQGEVRIVERKAMAAALCVSYNSS
jgi:hypothetical protein